MNNVRFHLVDEKINDYLKDSAREQNERNRNFVKNTASGLERAEIAKLRSTAPNQKAKRGLTDGTHAGFDPLESLKFQFRSWLGLHERGLTDDRRTAIVRNHVAGVVGIVAAVVLIPTVIHGTLQSQAENAALMAKQAATPNKEAVKPVGTTTVSITGPVHATTREVKSSDNTSVAVENPLGAAMPGTAMPGMAPMLPANSPTPGTMNNTALTTETSTSVSQLGFSPASGTTTISAQPANATTPDTARTQPAGTMAPMPTSNVPPSVSAPQIAQQPSAAATNAVQTSYLTTTTKFH